MLSMPPATITSWLPARSMSCANMAAFMPEPHILDSVTAPADSGRPPLSAAWRAGAWPWPAIRQLPNSTSPTVSGAMPARATAARMAAPPRSCAASDEKSPWKLPMGVRAAPTITTESDMAISFKFKKRVQESWELSGRKRFSRSYGNTSYTWPAWMRSFCACQ